jgi:thrombospondin motif-containing protein 9
MSSDNPTEFITLRKGNHENYSLFYSKRATDMSKCENGKGIHDESIHYGTTRFNKVRININTLQIIDDDYQFSHTVGRPQKFATGGDCYSNTGSCPQGDFFVNLEGTGFRIRPTLMWEANGTNSTIEYQIRVSFFRLSHTHWIGGPIVAARFTQPANDSRYKFHFCARRN